MPRKFNKGGKFSSLLPFLKRNKKSKATAVEAQDDNEELADLVLQRIVAQSKESFKNKLAQELICKRWAKALQAMRDAKAIWLRINFKCSSPSYSYSNVYGCFTRNNRHSYSYEFYVGNDFSHTHRGKVELDDKQHMLGKAVILFFSRYRRFRYLGFNGIECEDIIKPLDRRNCWPIQVDFLEMFSNNTNDCLLIKRLSPFFKQLHILNFPTSIDTEPLVQTLLTCSNSIKLSISHGFTFTVSQPFAEYLKIANIAEFSTRTYQLWHFEALKFNKNLLQLSFAFEKDYLRTLSEESLISPAILCVINKLRCIRFHFIDVGGYRSPTRASCVAHHESQLVAVDRALCENLTRIFVTQVILIPLSIIPHNSEQQTEVIKSMIGVVDFYFQMSKKSGRLFAKLDLDFTEYFSTSDQTVILNKIAVDMRAMEEYSDLVVRSMAPNRVLLEHQQHKITMSTATSTSMSIPQHAAASSTESKHWFKALQFKEY